MSRLRKFTLIIVLLIVLGIGGFVAYAWRAAIEPIAPPQADSFDTTLVEQGRLVAAAGNCMECHTASGGTPYAGGHVMTTPFGEIISTNITPDPEHGIGQWSLEAFTRAMREGVARDGSHLYPAFPYTAFTKMSDEDIHAVYAYLMSRPAEPVSPPETDLPFPFNQRALVAGWNLLFLDKGEYQPDPAQDAEWNRGAYLTHGAAHCMACHSPRNALGAEKDGKHFLAGGDVDGWHAPALNADAPAAVPWTQEALFQYLRHGHTADQGTANGSMAPVIAHGTSVIPESDVRAIARYIASYTGEASPQAVEDARKAANDRAAEATRGLDTDGARIYAMTCVACHEAAPQGERFGAQQPLWLGSTLYLDKPDNLLRFVLEGVQSPADPSLGFMPPFKDYLNDAQLKSLTQYLRTDLAGQPAWEGMDEAIERVRKGEANPM